VKAPLKYRYRNENAIEKMFYEIQPFLYISFALFTFITRPDSKFANLCAMILMFSGFMILRWRYQFRSTRRRG